MSPPPSLESSVHGGHPKNRARFEDDSTTAEVIFRRASIGSSQMRRRSAPPAPPSRNGSHNSLLVLHRSTAGSEQLDLRTHRQQEDMENLVAAVGIFEEVIEELIDVAGENTEDHDQLQLIADEVRETILEDRDDRSSQPKDRVRNTRVRIASTTESSSSDPDTTRRSAALDRAVTDHDAELQLHQCPSGSLSRRGSSADDNVDESVLTMADEDLEAIDEDTADSRLDLLRTSNRILLTFDDEPELKSPPLTPVPEEESEDSCDTVRITRPASPDTVFKRRVSDSQAYASLITEQHGDMKQRRASMPDFCPVKTILRLTPKAVPAGTVVTACSVRPAEPARLNSAFESSSMRRRYATPDTQSTRTAHTVRSNSGVLQMLWEEPAVSDSSSDAASVPVPQVASPTMKSPIRSGASSPMERVKSKLAT